MSGCATNQCPPPLRAESEIKPLEQVVNQNDLVHLLIFFQRIRAMGQDSLALEYALASQALAKARTDVNRLKLALLLSLPLAIFRDDARAAALADETLATKGGEPELKPLAFFVATVAAEQKRQEERYQLATQKLKEEERRTEARQQKLDALKMIEKDLINREQTKPLRVK